VQTGGLQMFFEALEGKKLNKNSLHSRSKDATIMILGYKS
jgi:hypothetical protein